MVPAFDEISGLLQTLYTRGHIRHQPEPVGGVRAAKNPYRFVRARASCVFGGTERARAAIALVANLGCKQILRRLLGRNTLPRSRDDQDLYGNYADSPHFAPPNLLPDATRNAHSLSLAGHRSK